jgi:hypothetical protein
MLANYARFVAGAVQNGTPVTKDAPPDPTKCHDEDGLIATVFEFGEGFTTRGAWRLDWRRRIRTHLDIGAQ